MLILLVIGLIVVIAILLGLRSLFRPQRMMRQPPPYPGYGRPPGYGEPYGSGQPYGSYGPPQRHGMSPGAAGALGAVGGGLLGYELGKMEGEQQQFHHDEMAMQQREDYGPYGDAGQGDWGGQGGDFGNGGGMGWDDNGGSW
jgi:hypothetical protein